MSGPGEEDEVEQEEVDTDWDDMENDPYSDEEKENIGDNAEGNDWKGD